MQIHFFLQSSALRVPHSFHTEKKNFSSLCVKNVGVYREFGAKIQVMEIKIRKLTLDLIHGGKKKHRSKSRLLRTSPYCSKTQI